ncbi:Dynamin-related protein 3A [Asimina triloba]
MITSSSDSLCSGAADFAAAENPTPASRQITLDSSILGRSMADDPIPSSSSLPPANPLGHAVIPIVNKLQDIFSQLGSASTIDLPQVAVVGSQSSGKSSVLEALVGRDFLPRGSDICTRRPLVLQLVNVQPGAGEEGAEWGEFLHLPGRKFFDFGEIRREIQKIRCPAVADAVKYADGALLAAANQCLGSGQPSCCLEFSLNYFNVFLVGGCGSVCSCLRAEHLCVVEVRREMHAHNTRDHVPERRVKKMLKAETDREAGGNKGVSDKQIRLKVFSPNVLNITLVDLPGITKVPVGDQPTDIELRIRNMILSYIKHGTCIILAVTPANADLANSDALSMARIADPDGSRTIGVITKLDIMDRGTDARNFLLGNVIPLQLGYVGVVNRSQEDIIYNRSIKEALAHEEEFFRKKSVYHGLSDRCGIPQLAKKLNQILVQHIRVVLPALKARISSQLMAVAKEHAAYGEIAESKTGQGALLLNILSKYSEVMALIGCMGGNSYVMFITAFSSTLEGKHDELSTSELSGGARVHYIFQSIFVKRLEEVDPCDGLTDDDIRTAIQNATGPKSALFVPQASVVRLIDF